MASARRSLIRRTWQAVRAATRAAGLTFLDYWQGAGTHGGYPSTDPRREILNRWRAPHLNANQLTWDLNQLAAQGRHLDRTTPVFRGMVEGRKAELVGTGIACEPDTGDAKLNADLKRILSSWLPTIGINRESIWTLQRMASGEIDVAGSFLWRWVDLDDRVDNGDCPRCLLPLEMEWLSTMPIEAIPEGHQFVHGVIIDKYGRAVAVDLVDPEQLGLVNAGERVPIDQVVLGFERRRPRQTLGEPRLVTLIERTLQDDEIVLTELKSAANTSALSVMVSDDDIYAQKMAELDGDCPAPERISPGSIGYSPSSAKITALSHTRPSASVKEFRATIRGDMAAGGQVSRVWTDRDGSAYNFANSKFDQIRTQQMVKPAHDWFGSIVASRIHTELVPLAFLMLGRPWPHDPAERARVMRHKLVPDVPPELDEASAVKGFEVGFRNKVTSRAAFVSSRGREPSEVATEIDAELRADGLAAIERAKALQTACNAANKDVAGLNLHWTDIVPQTLDAAPDAAPAPAQGSPDAA